jgi:putative spermidine/putrescine transport system permease protein
VAAAFTYAMPVRSRKALLTLTNIATNLGGVSLAFAFVALLGTNGMLTIMLRSALASSSTRSSTWHRSWG